MKPLHMEVGGFVNFWKSKLCNLSSTIESISLILFHSIQYKTYWFNGRNKLVNGKLQLYTTEFAWQIKQIC